MTNKMKATEWAKQEGIDIHLFLYWDSQLVTKNEYEKIKNSVYRGD